MMYATETLAELQVVSVRVCVSQLATNCGRISEAVTQTKLKTARSSGQNTGM